MTDCYYNGSTDSDYTNSANWVGGTTPSSGDSVYILPDCTNAITGVDATATLLVAFVVMPGVAVNIGSSGTKLQIACDEFRYSGLCPEAWIALRDGNGAGAVTQIDIFNGYTIDEDTAAASGLHLSSITTDTMSPCRVHGGYVSFDATSRIPSLINTGGTAFVNDATGISTVYAVAGWTYYAASAAVTTLEIGSQGYVYWQVGGGAVTTVNNHGEFYQRSASTLTTVNGWEGTANFTDCERTSTVTNCNLYNGNLDVRNHIGTPTFTNPINVYGSGQIYGDPGRTSDVVATP